jgi:carbamoyl-phosphate synthase large subunit
VSKLKPEAVPPGSTILIVGSGPIVIGQACEFDYSGTQACRVLKEDGYRVVLVNSNPATIMTDPEVAHRTYIEPITPPVVAKILEKEKIHALLPTLGGQTALNVAVALAENGTLERLGVQLIGANLDAIKKAEDRDQFRETMRNAGIPLPRSGFALSLPEAESIADEIGYPVIVRPSFTLGGAGGGRAENPAELLHIAEEALRLSPAHTTLIEEDLTGWKEIELEVMRDHHDNAVIVCGIENLDPMGVHTGDSITVAPIQTLTDREVQRLRDMALEVLRAVGVNTGGSNVQFAVNPRDGRMVVIEMNPRVSRSSALASKATGFPIAKIAARLAVGRTLDEIPNDITRVTPACFEPTLDYVVVKIPRWNFEKFPSADPTLGTRMKSVGEVMALGRTFPEAFMKALASLEIDGLEGLIDGTALGRSGRITDDELAKPTWKRGFLLLEAFRRGLGIDHLHALTHIDPWFLDQLSQIVAQEKTVRDQLPLALERQNLPVAKHILRNAKQQGLGDPQLGSILGLAEDDVRALRHRLDIRPVMKAVDTCAAEFPAETPYFYSTYDQEDEGVPLGPESVVVLGSGPNRIGQGVEFDYCCVRAAQAFRKAGRPVVFINSNPETVSTDYDTSDRLYFEPLTREHVRNVLDKEQPSGVVLQFGGQTPLKLAGTIVSSGVPILGTPKHAIDAAENREIFRRLLNRLGMRQPRSRIAVSRDAVLPEAERVGYPVLVRPSFVLGGRGMRIVYNRTELELLLSEGVTVTEDNPLLIDAFLEDAVEIDVDAVTDGETVLTGAVLEHVEEAGVHSGDSSCLTPPYSIGAETEAELREMTAELARALGVVGLLNVQYAVKGDDIFVIEANPRASRTVPFVSKATGMPLVDLAVQSILGPALPERKPDDAGLPGADGFLISVKKPVLPFERFPGADSLLGPEMKSTGEVMGTGSHFGEAYAKAQEGAGEPLPTEGTVFLSVPDADKRAIVFLAKQLVGMGFQILATRGTWRFLRLNGVPADRVFKMGEGKPTVVDAITSGNIHLVLNTPLGRKSKTDERAIRLAAVARRVPCVTTIPGMLAAVSGIEALRGEAFEVRALQDMGNRTDTQGVEEKGKARLVTSLSSPDVPAGVRHSDKIS